MDSRTLIVLDTHAWIWWAANSPRLSAATLDAISRANEIDIGAISTWEVAAWKSL